MKRTIHPWLPVLALASLLSLNPCVRSIAAAAEPSRNVPPTARGERGAAVRQRLETLSRELNLTEDQRSKLEALFRKEAEKARGLRDLPPEQRREKVRALRDETVPEVKKILTAEQFEKWQKIRSERASRNRADATQRRPGDKPPSPSSGSE